MDEGMGWLQPTSGVAVTAVTNRWMAGAAPPLLLLLLVRLITRISQPAE